MNVRRRSAGGQAAECREAQGGRRGHPARLSPLLQDTIHHPGRMGAGSTDARIANTLLPSTYPRSPSYPRHLFFSKCQTALVSIEGLRVCCTGSQEARTNWNLLDSLLLNQKEGIQQSPVDMGPWASWGWWVYTWGWRNSGAALQGQPVGREGSGCTLIQPRILHTTPHYTTPLHTTGTTAGYTWSDPVHLEEGG